MTEFKVYGASDDLIEIDGDIGEELYFPGSDHAHLACYDGTLLEVTFDGNWKFRCTAAGYAFDRVEQFKPGSDDATDIVYFNDRKDNGYPWFVVGEQWAVAEPGR